MRAFLTFATALTLSAPLLVACSSTTPGRGLGDGGITSNPGISPPAGSNGNGAKNSTSCFASGDLCSCSYAGSGSGNATTCDESTMPSAVCCGDIGWPDKNLSCSCNPFTCKKQNGSTGDSCQCGTYESGNLTSCTDTVCCASTDITSCHCGPSITCDSYETQVTSCSAAVVVCTGSSQARTTSCSTQ